MRGAENMYITITDFLDKPPRPLPDATHANPWFAHWIKFQSDIVSGCALLVPSGVSIEQLRQNPALRHISVETSQRAVKDFRLLPNTEAKSYQFEALTNPGDYDLTGEIWDLDVQEDGKIAGARVRGESCIFWLTANDFSLVRVEEGTWVRFRTLELFLHDENL